MPSNFSDILRKYAEIHEDPSQEEIDRANGPKEPIIGPTDEEAYVVAAGRQSDRGTLVEDERLDDFRNMTFLELANKYGMEAASNIAQQRTKALRSYSEDRIAADSRFEAEEARDRLVDVGSGLANTAMGVGVIGGMGIDAVADTNVALSVAEAQKGFNEFADEQRSSGRRRSSRADEAQYTAAGQDSEAIYKQDVQEKGKFLATLSKIGRDAMDAFEIVGDSNVAAERIINEAIGSLGGSALLMRAATKGTLKLTDILARDGIVSAASKATVDKAGQIVVGGAVIGSIETGGTYAEAANEVMAMSHEELVASSPDYVEIYRQVGSVDEAKKALADSTGKMAAMLSAPIAIGGGAAMNKFLMNPFKSGGVRDSLINVAEEGLEETAQGANSAFASNLAIQSQADRDRNLADGVGRSITEGAIGGLSSGGVVQAPGAAARGTAEVSKAAYTGVRDGLVIPAVERLRARGERIENELAKSGGAAGFVRNKVGNAANSLADYLDGKPESAEQFESELAQVAEQADSVEFSRDEVRGVASQSLFKKLRKATDIESAFDIVAKQLNGSNDDAEVESAWQVLEHLENRRQAIQSTAEELSAIEPAEGQTDTEALGKIQGAAQKIADAVTGSEKIQQSVEKAKTGLAKIARKIGEISEQEIQTPEGQRKAKAVIDAAELTPGDVNPLAVGTILEHSKKGLIDLSSEQTKVLTAVSNMVQRQREFLDSREAEGINGARDLVRREVLTDRDNTDAKEASVADRVSRINRAYRAGDLETAKAELKRLALFAQHYQNKLAAINAHHEGGTGDAKQAPEFQGLLSKSGKMVPMRGAWVNAQVPNSVKQAKAVAAEARLVGSVVNDMTQVFDDLGVAPVQLTGLHPELTAPVDQVVAKAKTKTNGKNLYAPAQSEESPNPTPSEDQPASVDQDGEAVTGEQAEGQVEAEEASTEPEETPEPEVSASQIQGAEALGREDARSGERSQPPADYSDAEQLAWFRGYSAELKTLAEERDQPSEAEQVPVETPEPVVEEVPVEEVTEPVTPEPEPEIEPEVEAEPEVEEAVEEPADKSDLRTLFPRILGAAKDSAFVSYFLESFRAPINPKSRLLGTGSPMELVFNALGNADAALELTEDPQLAAAVDKAGVAESYQSLLETDGEAIRNVMRKRLKEFFAKNKNTEKLLYKNRFPEGKAMNIVEGSTTDPRYNQELLEGAILAGLNWLLTSNRYKTPLDEDSIYSLFVNEQKGRDEQREAMSAVTRRFEQLKFQMGQGPSQMQAVRALGDSVLRFWGVESSKDASIAHAEGIPEAVGKEVLNAMRELGYIKVISPVEEAFKNEESLPGGLKKPQVVQVTFGIENAEDRKAFMESEGMFEYPDLIERAVMIQPERMDYIGAPPEEVAQTQHNNRRVKNSPLQKKALAARQNNAFTANMPWFNLVTGMGDTGVQRAFAGGEINEENEGNFNGRDLATRKGRNTTFLSAFRSMRRVMSSLGVEAELKGKSPEEIEVFYAYNFNRMNRLQMMGLDNPQSSKLMREFMLPTWSTLDLSNQNSKAYQAFLLSIGQHLGVKTHLRTMGQVIAETETRLAAAEGSIALLQDWLAKGGEVGGVPANITDQLIEDLGERMEPAAVHSLLDYARFQNASEAEKAKFKTGLYLEADGVTNGPMNALLLHTVGEFTPEWLENVRRGGLFIGRDPMSLNDFVENHTYEDLYQTSSSKLTRIMHEELNNLSFNQPEIAERMELVLQLMDDMFGKDVVFNDDGSVTFDRGIAKNPLTVTVYGSGAQGIANKVVHRLLGEVSILMTTALQAKQADDSLSAAEAMFGKTEGAQEKFDRIYNALNTLSRDLVSDQGGYSLLTWDERNAQERKILEQDLNFSAKDFEMEGLRLNILEENLKSLFASQMQSAIHKTMGDELMSPMGDIRTATQITSIALKHEFRKRIDERIKWKKDNVEGYAVSDFLTYEELSDIFKSLAPLAPVIEGKEQSFYFAGSQVGDLSTEFSRSLSGDLKSPGFVDGIASAGTRGMPGMVIGPGDGMMMALLGDVVGSLDVYDGLNMPVDKIEEFSRRANEAVFQTWQRNPMGDLAKNYRQFLTNMDFNKMPEAAVDDIRNLLFNGLEARKAKRNDVIKRMFAMGHRLESHADSIAARHEALAQFPQSVDQMASGMTPYVNEGSVELSESVDDEDLVAKLNEAYKTAHDKVTGKRTEVKSGVPQEVADLGIKTEQGHYVINGERLGELGTRLGTNNFQKKLLSELIGPMQTRGFSVIAGSKEQLIAYAHANKISKEVVRELSHPDSETNGVTLPGKRVVLLINPSAEVLVHEMVHAASIDAVTRYYAKEDLGPQKTVQVGAIQRLETLMKQFLALDTADLDGETLEAFTNARAAILTHKNRGNMANAMNEFMAWGLTNAKLAEKLSQTKANPIVVLARKAYDAIKKVIWGKRSASPVLDDMLTNLRFNTTILTEAQLPGDPRSLFDETILYHSTGAAKGDRLRDIDKTFRDHVLRHLVKQERTGNADYDNKLARAEWAKLLTKFDNLTNGTTYAFPMDMQERSTYQLVQAALASSARFDANALSRAAELYSHVAETITIADFMQDPESDDPRDTYEAGLKMRAVLGKLDETTDDFGRSNLIANFVALAMVNDDFRKVLSKIPMPEAQRNEDGTLDAALENAGASVMRKFGDFVSGQGSDKADVGAAMDALLGRVIETSKERKSWYDRIIGPMGDLTDKGNSLIISAAQKAAESSFEWAGRQKRKTNSKTAKAAYSSVRVMSAIFNEKTSGEVANAVVSAMNKSRLPTFVREGIVDVVGRTSGNANIYDLIKRVHNWVQQRRQQYREELPRILSDKFSRPLTEDETKALFRGVGKTDLMALRKSMLMKDIVALVKDPSLVPLEIQKLEQQIAASNPGAWPFLQAKSKQLAKFMNTGEQGSNLLRNANAVAELLNVDGVPEDHKVREDLVDRIDELVTLYALDTLPSKQKDLLSALAESESEGLEYAFATLEGLRKSELEKANGMGFYNHYKGHTPSEVAEKGTIIVATDSKAGSLKKAGLVRIGDYEGSSLENFRNTRGYYFLPATTKAGYRQGILQNVQHTVSGVDEITGATHGRTVSGRIRDPQLVKRIAKFSAKEKGKEPLLPIFNEQGEVVAYERSVDPQIMNQIPMEEKFLESLGMWAGRLVEEKESSQVNFTLLTEMKGMYDRDVARTVRKKSEYVNLFDSKTLKKDPVLADIMNSLPGATLRQIEAVFGGDKEFWVRRDMLNDTMGYRKASVRDLWTGNSRLPKPVLDTTRQVLVGVFGKDAFRYMANSEDFIQNAVTDIKVLIVIKSVIVPAGNLAANVLQLWARGVPVNAISSGMARKTSEIDDYLRSRDELTKLEADLNAAGVNATKRQKIEAKMQAITDRHRRLSIWPLIEAGEFTSISDATVSHEDMAFSKGRLSSYFEQQVEKLPEGAQTMARYGLVSRDTALFKGLQRSIEYGDFLAKAVLYDELTRRQGKSQKEALAAITEEFVNYDRLPGRTRGYLEDMGLLWFWHFKMRSMKVAASMLRNNPLHVFLAGLAPTPDFLGTVGSPVEDNLASVWWDNRLGYSVGPEMGWRALFLNPWVNLTT